MTSGELVDLLTQLAVMLLAAMALGLAARKLKQPSVVGEMFAGVLIGVTVLGSLAPGVYDWLFEATPLVTSTRNDFIKIGMLFFLYVAGSEVDLADFKTLGRSSLIIGFIGTVLPIGFGIGLVYITPISFWGESMGVGRLAFAAFIGMTMANSANPVLARILIDLGMMKSRLATMMMTATVVDDLVNWTLYAIILGSVTTAGGSSSDRTLAVDLLLVALLFVVVLGGVRWLAPRIVDLARRHLPWPSGYVAVVAVVLLAVSAFSEAVGVQAFLGAFLAGVAFSGVAAGPGAAGQKSIAHMAIAFFAPLFFVSMALRTDFVESFDLLMVTVVLVVALAAKLISVLAGVKAAGMPVGREAWAIAWGLNARGTTGIILAATGLQTGIINDEVFVALVVMSIVTSILAGPMMLRVLGPVAAKYRVDEVSGEEPSAVVAAATRVVERDMTEHERRALERALFYRVVVAIDDPSTAQPLVEFATELASSQQPAEVVLVSLKQQTEVERLGTSSFLDAIADDLGSVRDLERLVRDRGLAVVSTSQRSSDVASDIAARALDVGANALVVGDRRDDPAWVATVDRLIALTPTDIYVVVAPLPRGQQPVRHGPPVIEAGTGLPGEASLEAGLRIALAGGQGPIVVGVTAGDGPDYQALLDRLAALDRPGRVLTDGLDTIDGAATAAAARFVVRSFSAPEGLEPVERARPDAERFGCPVVLVAPHPDGAHRTGLDALLDTRSTAAPAGDGAS